MNAFSLFSLPLVTDPSLGKDEIAIEGGDGVRHVYAFTGPERLEPRRTEYHTGRQGGKSEILRKLAMQHEGQVLIFHADGSTEIIEEIQDAVVVGPKLLPAPR